MRDGFDRHAFFGGGTLLRPKGIITTLKVTTPAGALRDLLIFMVQKIEYAEGISETERNAFVRPLVVLVD